MFRRSMLSSISVVSLVVVACGGSSEDGGGGKTLSIEDLPAEYAKAQCGLYKKCFGDVFGLFSKGEDCETLTKTRVESSSLGQLAAGVAAGKIKYDGAKAADCLAEIAARSCDALAQRTSEACDLAAEGSVAAGESCDYDFDCVGSLYCKFDSACPGKCSERQPAGAGCKRDDDCQDGLVCGGATQACVKPGAVGDACGGGVAPECAPTLTCAGASAATQTAGKCKAFSDVFSGGPGSACSFKELNLCTADQSCVFEGTPPTNGACAKKVASGAACKRASIPSACPAGEYCDGGAASADGTCKALPGAGEPCATELGDQVCAPYTRCDAGTCVALQNNGGPCKSDQACYSETCVGGVCKINACQ